MYLLAVCTGAFAGRAPDFRDDPPGAVAHIRNQHPSVRIDGRKDRRPEGWIVVVRLESAARLTAPDGHIRHCLLIPCLPTHFGEFMTWPALVEDTGIGSFFGRGRFPAFTSAITFSRFRVTVSSGAAACALVCGGLGRRDVAAQKLPHGDIRQQARILRVAS